jgi:hypothetical protein
MSDSKEDPILGEYIELRTYCADNNLNYEKVYSSLKKYDIEFSNTLGGVFVLASVFKKHINNVFTDAEQTMKQKRIKTKKRMKKTQISRQGFEEVVLLYNQLPNEKIELLKRDFKSISDAIETKQEKVFEPSELKNLKGNGSNVPPELEKMIANISKQNELLLQTFVENTVQTDKRADGPDS